MKRLTYKEDGSQLWRVTTSFATGNQTALTDAQDDILNGDQTQTAEYVELITAVNTLSGIIIKFAKAIAIDQVFLSFFWATRSGAATSALLVEASANSTDGNDGAWTTLHSETLTVEAASSNFRLFLRAQTEDEKNVQTYTYLRVSWGGNANLNNLRLMNFWAYGEYSSPPYDFYDSRTLTPMRQREVVFGLFAGDAVVSKKFKYIIKNLEASGTANRTYTLTIGKVKSTADAVFAAHMRLSTDGSTKATSIDLTVAAGETAEFYVHIDIPVNGGTNGNPQDAALHYGKITVAEATLTVEPGFVFAVFYDTKANIELLTGNRLVNICLVFQRDVALPGSGAWSWWDTYGVDSCVQQEDVGNDIVLLLTSDGYVWEMDRGEYDNEEFAPEPIQMLIRSLELPADVNPHIWRRNLWFDFDVEGADPGVVGEYRLIANKDTGKVTTSQDIEIGNPGMRLSEIDVGHQFNHELRVFGGGNFWIKNLACSYQDLTVHGRKPYIAA